MIRELANSINRFSRAGSLIALLLILCSLAGNAQPVSASLKADSNHILIGDYLKVTLTIKTNPDVKVSLRPITDTLGTMDVVMAGKIDTIVKDNSRTLTQAFVVSAYDSGLFRIGPEKIKFKDKNGVADSILSDFVIVKVATVAVDTTKAFKAIKAPLEVPYSWREFIPYIIGAYAVLLILSLLFLWYMFRKRKQKKAMERARPKDPAHIWARKELKKLEEEKLWQKDEVKHYYSRMSDILRLYLEYRYGWFALESTTEEIKDNIDSYRIPSTAKDSLFMILENADLVKFAKMTPPPDVNTRALENAYKFIEYTEQREITSQPKANV